MGTRRRTGSERRANWLERSSLFALLVLSACEASFVPVGDGNAAVLSRTESALSSTSPSSRIVTAALLAEDLLVDILPAERWVGISFVVDWPSATLASTRFPRAVPRVNGGAESILLARPDLAILSDYNQASTEAQLSSAGVRTWRVKAPSTGEELFSEWTKLGRLVGEEARAEIVIARARERWRRLRGAAAKSRVLLLQGRFSYAAGSLPASCLRHAGFENVLGDDPRGTTPELSHEEVVSLAPELIFVSAPVPAPRLAGSDEDAGQFPRAAFPKGSTIYFVPEALVGAVSQFAIDALETYVTLAQRSRR